MTTHTEIDLAALASVMGELCGAARYDLTATDPADVGLNGVPVVGWRDAYFTGCKDMADTVLSALPAEHQEAFTEAARAAFTKGFDDAAKAASDGETLGETK